ncbi:MAG: hypothetical protein ACKO4Z_03410 [Planctomycetota bacterium]|nr:hypothetical protein [Planctomycetota bacterium]
MATDPIQLDAAFEALAAYDWDRDAAPLATIDAAVVRTHGDAAQASDLERRFLTVVAGPSSRAAKEYACRKLSLVGTAAAVPALAALLADHDQSHMARFALERIPAAEAAEALRQALGTVDRELAVGVISSLANRRDAASVARLAELLGGDDDVAMAAAAALGRIGTAAAAEALAAARPRPGAATSAVLDARIACADALLASGDRTAARQIFAALEAALPARPQTHRERALRVAVTSGGLACLDDSVAP